MLKKIIISLLALSMLFSSTACDAPDSTTQTTTTTTKKEPLIFDVESHDFHCSTLEEYENALAKLKKPSGFIHHDQLASLGEFKHFDVGYVTPHKEFDMYIYELDYNGIELSLNIFAHDDPHHEDWYPRELNAENLNTDLRTHIYTEESDYTSLSKTYYFADPMIRFEYKRSTGMLSCITMLYETDGQYIFILLLTDFKQFNPNNPDHIINRLLNKNTAIQAKDEIMQAIYDTPEQSPAK